jgi:hypothetical protein
MQTRNSLSLKNKFATIYGKIQSKSCIINAISLKETNWFVLI